MPAGAGKIFDLAITILPKTWPPVKLKVLTFGNGGALAGDWRPCQSAVMPACATPAAGL